jgi:hypothetical protein
MGGDQCEKENYDEDEAANSYQELILKAKEKVTESKNVTLCSITQRTNPTHVQGHIDSLNTRLSNFAEVNTMGYINHDLHFKLANGDTNDGYLHVNGKQLSKCGRKRFVADLGLPLKATARGDPSKAKKTKTNKDEAMGASNNQPVESPRETSERRAPWAPRYNHNQGAGHTRPQRPPHNKWMQPRQQPFRTQEGGDASSHWRTSHRPFWISEREDHWPEWGRSQPGRYARPSEEGSQAWRSDRAYAPQPARRE